ncbi:MAG: hypothetical protein OXK76_09305 [Gammaproteobacteria bacterium]|nr:hypothetical protein [Gammaproteobacteria bacterium]
MTLRADLSRLIQGQFDEHDITYPPSLELERLAASYFEMTVRRIHPTPRRVHFSEQSHASLGGLSRQGEDSSSARTAWRAVFRLRRCFVDGENVDAFLSRTIRNAGSWDGLLWQYGMHHFHLGTEATKDGFVKRSDYLLFAIVAPEDAYFVDVRDHPPPGSVEWASMELLRIVHSNWPRLMESHVLRGVDGDELADEELRALRRKDVNSATHIGGSAIAPLFGGLAADGSSVLCTLWARSLLSELRHHEDALRNVKVRASVERELRARGFDVGSNFEVELVFLEDLDLTPALQAALSAEACISRNLCQMGLAVVERKTRMPLAIRDTWAA